MRKLTLAFAAAAVLATAPAATAAELKVTGGQLDWTMANNWTSGATDRTWLGYLTNTTGGPGAANGSMSVAGGATLTGPAGPVTPATVGTTAQRGTDQLYTFSYPTLTENAGTISENGVGTITFQGQTTFVSHTIPVTFNDIQIRLNGLTGTLHAKGVGGGRGGSTPFDYTATQMDLDLSKAELRLRPDGSRVITGIVPTTTGASVFGASGTATDFVGRLALTLNVQYPDAATGPKGDKGEPGTTTLGSPGTQGPAGPQGPVGPRGPAGKTGKSAKISTFTLKSAPFAGTATRKVRVLQRKTGKLLASGTLKGRTLRVSHLATTKLKGSYVVKLTAGKRRAVISIR